MARATKITIDVGHGLDMEIIVELVEDILSDMINQYNHISPLNQHITDINKQFLGDIRKYCTIIFLCGQAAVAADLVMVLLGIYLEYALDSTSVDEYDNYNGDELTLVNFNHIYIFP